jgi:hypothetical protein
MSTPVAQARPLTAAQRDVLGRVLADALEHRTPGWPCHDCEVHPAGLCDRHGADYDTTDEYLRLAGDLGIEVPG